MRGSRRATPPFGTNHLPAGPFGPDPVLCYHRLLVTRPLTRTGTVRSAGVLGAVALVVIAVGCAEKMTTQQALVEEAFGMCRAQGPSAKLERVDRDGRFSVVGKESDSQRVHDCMVRYAEPAKRPAPAGAAATTAPPAGAPAGSTTPAPVIPRPATPIPGMPPTATPAPDGGTPATGSSVPKAEAMVASRLPGTWRGTLKLPPRASGEAEVSSPAMLRFAVTAGSLRWSLASGTSGAPLNADGTAIVVDGEVRMTGTLRGDSARSNITVRYAGAMVGDRLEVTGVTTDRQVHVLTIRRTGE